MPYSKLKWDMTEDKNTTKIPSPMDYDGLCAYGLDYIRKAGSRYWTDFNVHDPGVTILEALTLSINDLSYRSSASMADLLTRKGGRRVSLEGAMFPAEVILSNAPTTADDYRKIMLENIPGIRNIWFIPADPKKNDGMAVKVPYEPKRLEPGTIHLGGGYHVLVELENLEYSMDERRIPVIGGWAAVEDAGAELDVQFYQERYRHCIRTLFFRYRNLCEDLIDIRFMEQVQVGLSARLEMESGADMRAILQEMYDRLYEYVSPTIPFHTVEDLLARGRKAQEIFSVPSPRLGFIDRQELASFDRKTDLYVSDVISILMGIQGIRSVHHVRFIVKDTPAGKRVKERIDGSALSIRDCEDLTFDFVPDFLRNRREKMSLFVNSIVFSLNGLTFLPPPPKGEDGVRVQMKKDERAPLPAGFDTVMPVPEGSYRETNRYFSFQNLFPATYRMGDDLLPESASTLRKAERMQLKAYLTFFDQLLSDYLAQIDRFQDLLSVKTGEDQDTNATYFHGRLTDDDIVDVSKVLRWYPEYPVPAENMGEELVRKNAVLDHLLSRFAESFAEYATLEYIRNNVSDNSALRETVEDKKRFLGDYPRISSLRSCGIDWTGTELVTGAERRIMRRLGIDQPDAREGLSRKNELGLYLVEHNQLAPRSSEDRFLELAVDDDDPHLLEDPYSFRVTAVLPGWTDLTANLNFRKYTERIIREEIPVHVFVKVCWISREVMAVFEEAYTAWHSVMKEGTGLSVDSSWEKRRCAANNAMVSALGQFSNVYQEAVLMPDEVSDYDDGESLTRLDSTYLGNETGIMTAEAGPDEEAPLDSNEE